MAEVYNSAVLNDKPCNDKYANLTTAMGQIQKVIPTSTSKPPRNPGPFSDMDLQHEADRLLEGEVYNSAVLNDKPCNDKYAMKCVILSVDGGHLFSSP
jgi:hypothetical protein